MSIYKKILGNPELDQYKSETKKTLDQLENINKELSIENETIIKVAGQMLAENQEIMVRLKAELNEKNARYSDLFRVVEECIEKNKYKALREYVAAVETCGRIETSEKVSDQTNEFNDAEWETILEEIEN